MTPWYRERKSTLQSPRNLAYSWAIKKTETLFTTLSPILSLSVLEWLIPTSWNSTKIKGYRAVLRQVTSLNWVTSRLELIDYSNSNHLKLIMILQASFFSYSLICLLIIDNRFDLNFYIYKYELPIKWLSLTILPSKK